MRQQGRQDTKVFYDAAGDTFTSTRLRRTRVYKLSIHISPKYSLQRTSLISPQPEEEDPAYRNTHIHVSFNRTLKRDGYTRLTHTLLLEIDLFNDSSFSNVPLTAHRPRLPLLLSK